MNLRDLRYFVALADTRHFGKAAERSFVSQPTLSAQIKKLETYLGVQLIERQPRKVALTETGAKILPLARRILQESDEIVSLARNEHDPLSGKLKVAPILTIGPYLLPLVARKLRKQLLRLKLMLYEHQTQPLLEKLRAGDIDLGILALPVPLDGLEARALYDESFTLAVPNNSPLAKRSNIKVDDLNGETLLLRRRHCLRDQALMQFAAASTSRRARTIAPRAWRPWQMVAAGLGITLLPSWRRAARSAPARGSRSRHSRGRSPRAASAQCGARARRARTQSRLCATRSTPRWFPERRWPSRAFPASATCTTTRSSRCCAPRTRHAADGVLRRAGYRELSQLALAFTRRNPRGRRVFVLPGIMGSRLGLVARRSYSLLWLHPTALANGELTQLAIPPAALRARRDAAGLPEAAPAPGNRRLSAAVLSVRLAARRRAPARLRQMIERSGERKALVVGHTWEVSSRAALAHDKKRRIAKLISSAE